MSRTNRITEIEQQMAHLEWLKAQNERAYRNTLEKTKVMHQNDIILKMSVDNNNERTLWMSSVIKDELSKPLVLSDSEIYQSRKKIEQDNIKLTKVIFLSFLFPFFLLLFLFLFYFYFIEN